MNRFILFDISFITNIAFTYLLYVTTFAFNVARSGDSYLIYWFPDPSTKVE